ncbi:MAG: DUF4065 domain-containing protein [Treponema sp.]|jgi:uncharacterized phage-associated protein|nr:DUF4065 domain-containing protein [Treponema sp.]
MEKTNMTSVYTVAGFILQTGKANDKEGGCDLITNMKMQKLVYYCQGFYLALYDTPLFAEPLEAWEHGPVCPPLYHELKAHGANPLPYNGDDFYETLNKQEVELILEIYGVYGQFAAWRLREMTHQAPPWRDTPFHQVIPHDLMNTYFKTQLIA